MALPRVLPWKNRKFWSLMTKKRFAKSSRRCSKRRDTLHHLLERPLGLEAFRKDTFDLVLSDIVMPEMDGLKLLAELRQDDPDVPVIMVTAMHDISIALEAIRAGAYDYILKPFERDQLHLSVRRALEHRQLVIENRTYQTDLEHLVAERTQQLSIALQDLEQSYDYTLEALGGALDAKDAETEGHCQRVTAFTITIARSMDVDKGLLRHIARGAFLHDIGKMGVPDQILRKPGPLTAEEREIMRRHCEIGFAVLERIPFLKEAAEIVLSHQECYDGSGYPRGLKGEADSARSADFRGGRHARRDDFRPSLPQGVADFRRARGDSAIFRNAI